MTRCAVVQCEMSFDVRPVRIQIKAPTSSSVTQPRIEFETELCPWHREAFDAKRHTVLVSTRQVKVPA